MSRRLAYLPFLLVLASAPALRTAVRAQDNGADQKDGDDRSVVEAPSDSDGAKPAAEASKNDDGAETKDGEGKFDDKSPLVVVKVLTPEGEPAQADISTVAPSKPKAHKKKSKSVKTAKAAKVKMAPVKTAAAKAAAAPAAPPLPPAVPVTPVEPWNP